MDPTRYANIFRRNQWVINQQIEGLTHDDSLMQLPFRGNCLNWVVGHILESRNELLEKLGEATFMTPEQAEPYGRGSDPITGNGPHVLHMDSLQAMMAASLDSLVECLNAMPAEMLDTVVNEEHGTLLIDRIEFFNWHESYHVGQLEYLRQLTGTDDSVIG
jgi:hypothetical protein